MKKFALAIFLSVFLLTVSFSLVFALQPATSEPRNIQEKLEKLSKVIKFYDESLTKLGWESMLQEQSETNYVYNIKNASQEGSIIVNTAADNKKTAITIFVSPR